MTIFYSQSCMKIEKGKLQQVIDTGCRLSICRLRRTGRNALDFYIASRVGELFGNGYQGIVAIVSSDKGYGAVQDYWACREPARRVIVQPDIEQCIGCSNESSERRLLLQERQREADLEEQYALYLDMTRQSAGEDGNVRGIKRMPDTEEGKIIAEG